MSSRPKHSSSSKGSSSKDSGHKSSGHKKEHRSKQKGNSLQSSQSLYTPAATPTQDYYLPEDGATTSYGTGYGNANDAYTYDQAAVPNKQWYCCNCGNGTNSYNYNSKCVNAQHCNHTRCYNCEVFE